jgi:hypothetical protein
MGADGYILDPDQPCMVEIRCHTCCGPVSEGRPSMGHKQCISEDGRLFVNIETDDNYEVR